MAGLQRLRLLIRWGNAMGVQPFRMELDPNDGTFRRFEFSWKRWSTWWFVVCSLLHASATFFLQCLEKNPSMRRDLSNATKIAYWIIIFNYKLIALGPYLLLVFWKHLATVVRHVNNFDEMVCSASSWPCATKRHTLIGITISIITVRIETLS